MSRPNRSQAAKRSDGRKVETPPKGEQHLSLAMYLRLFEAIRSLDAAAQTR